MTRATYVYCSEAGRVVPAGEDAASRRRRARDNGGPAWLAAPMVWGVMPETRHIIDAKVYDSREKYNAVTRAHGATEIGHAEQRKLRERGHRPEWKGPTVKQSLKEALQRQGHL